MRFAKSALALFLILSVAVAVGPGCDNAGPDNGSGFVTVKFQVGSTTAKHAGKVVEDPLIVERANGRLSVDDIHLIVDKLKFEADDDACEMEEEYEEETGTELDDSEDDCEEVESEPFFLDLPLPAGEVDLVREPLPAGTYDEFEFEVDDIEMDEDEDESEVASLVTEVRALFSDWPDEASARVSGSFTPTGEDARPFTVYVKAEIEVEMDIDPPLVVDDSGSSRAVTVVLDPEIWFVDNDQVLDLSAFDYSGPEDLLELSVKMKEGFELRIEAEEDDD